MGAYEMSPSFYSEAMRLKENMELDKISDLELEPGSFESKALAASNLNGFQREDSLGSFSTMNRKSRGVEKHCDQQLNLSFKRVQFVRQNISL